MRVAVGSLGPVWLIEWRVVLGALMLVLLARAMRQGMDWRQQWRRYLMLGVFNTAMPFVLFAWAAQTLTASLLSVVNATAPIWGAVIEHVWAGTPLSRRRVLGLVLGIAGVALLLGLDPSMLHPDSPWAVLAALLAPLGYAIASQYTRQAPPHAPMANAGGGMTAGALLLMPALFLVPFTPVPQVATTEIWVAVIGLGLLCTGLAYWIYFYLVSELGAASALTVGFLIPAFGMLWGHLYLHEVLGWHSLFGTVTVLIGTALVTGVKFNAQVFRVLLRKR